MRIFNLLIGVAAITLSLASPAKADIPPACADQFFQGQPPTAPADETTQMLCFEQYSVLFSSTTRTPLWSAEHLTVDRVNAARSMQRVNQFHSEKQVSHSATLSDYLGSHYDRGHMSPNDDMGDKQAQFEAFSLANIVPQDPCNNEIIWKAIEAVVRKYVLEHGDVYIVTGPIFQGPTKTIGAHAVHVPSALFKAIYDPRLDQMIILTTANANVQTYAVETAQSLVEAAGVIPFPAVQDSPATLSLPALPQFSGVCARKVGQRS